MKILITAFEPFNQQTENASYEILQNLDYDDSSIEIIKVFLPVVYDYHIYKTLIMKHHPSIILHLGEAYGRSLIGLERRAKNLKSANIPDNEGVIFTNELIHPLGPEERLTTLPIESIYQAVQKQNNPIEISESAGTYICNLALYASLEAIEALQWPIQVGFIHFPRLDHQKNSLNIPTLSLKTSVDCLTAILRSIINEER